MRTPVSDIENLGERLRALGLETYVVPDADRSMMAGVLSRFREVVDRLPLGSSIFVYFAGHGFQRDGENYLVPVDAADAGALTWSCIKLSDVLTSLCWRSDQQKIIALDACRTNRIPGVTRDGEGGLAMISTGRYEAVKETVVFYATEPGCVALDGATRGSSPFCRGLLRALDEPHHPISLLTAHVTDFVCEDTGDMQTPWSTGTLRRVRPFIAGGGNGELSEPGPSPPNLGLAQVTATASRIVDPADREVAAKGHLIHKLKAKDSTGRWAYYFVLVEPARERAFLDAINGSGTMDIENYGAVVASCYGEEPTSQIREYLNHRYGFVV